MAINHAAAASSAAYVSWYGGIAYHNGIGISGMAAA